MERSLEPPINPAPSNAFYNALGTWEEACTPFGIYLPSEQSLDPLPGPTQPLYGFPCVMIQNNFSQITPGIGPH